MTGTETETALAADPGEGKSSSHFVCPDGDIHPVKDVSSIWVEWSWWRRKWRVRLEYADGETWNWDRDSEADAKRTRDAIISDLFI